MSDDYVSAIQNRISLQYNYAQLLVAYDYYAIALPDASHTPNAPQVAPAVQQETTTDDTADTSQEQTDYVENTPQEQTDYTEPETQ